ncbi:MAG: murein hydrolase activator EnvC family protein [Pseudomonadales bacterium]
MSLLSAWRTHGRQAFIKAIMLCSALSAFAAPAEPDEAALEAELIELKAVLQRVAVEQSLLRDQRDDKTQSIRDLDQEIAAIVKTQRAAERNARKAQTQIEMLTEHQETLIDRRDAQKSLIREHIIAASRLGETGLLKVLLNQEDPNQLSRISEYYRYLSKARMRQVSEFEHTLAELAQNELALIEESSAFEKAADEIALASETLAERRSELSVARASLDAQYATSKARTNVLERDALNLKTLLEQIRRNLIEFPSTLDFQSIKSRKGELPLPLTGNIRHRFGDRRFQNKVRWDGLVIDAPSGTKVTAVHYGRVVFADWLRGFGLMVILRHSDGFMSLYGHNQVIYLEVGDWVLAGQTIAEVGQSGGQAAPSTYFEIRDQGQPVDPLIWCNTKAMPGRKG